MTESTALRHPEWMTEVECDVRADLRAGREPFSRIMRAASALGDAEVLHLRAIFEPAPLFGVLAARGLVHESQEHAPDDWSVWFWRPGAAEPAAASATPAAKPVAPKLTAAGTTVILDVRGGAPPAPMLRTLAALETLPHGHELVQVNDRIPQFLLPMLVERGFAYEIDDSAGDTVRVHIRHAK